MYSELCIDMNSNKWILISVADEEVSTAVTAHVDLLPSTGISFLLSRNDITVDSTGQTSAEGHVQIPVCRGEVTSNNKMKTGTNQYCY